MTSACKCLEAAARVCDTEAAKYSQQGKESAACRVALTYAEIAILDITCACIHTSVMVVPDDDGFHLFLDDVWPLWRAHRGNINYNNMKGAWNAGRKAMLLAASQKVPHE